MAKRTSPKTPEESKAEIQAVFPEVLKLVKNGLTISGSLKTLKIDRTRFYSNITQIQKTELGQAKTLQTQYGIGYTNRNK